MLERELYRYKFIIKRDSDGTMLKIDYKLLNNLNNLLCEKLNIINPSKLNTLDIEISIKKSIDIAFENAKDLITKDSILSETDIKNYLFITIYSDLKNLEYGERTSIDNYVTNHYMGGYFNNRKKNKIPYEAYDKPYDSTFAKVNGFLINYRKNFGNNNLYSISIDINSTGTDNRIYPSEVMIMNYLTSKYMKPFEGISKNSIPHIEINKDEKFIAQGKFSNLKDYDSWILFMKKLVSTPELIESPTDNFSLLEIKKLGFNTHN
ncbi:hypothetical protein LGL55_21185 [Clostridium tagluense]|uniref:hypothetical protein n=1 Tax=Clostridium tagluense TaxID=360422 RepID=UPI001CF22BDB|nr:hypothetical protein [Clostridium tagluense]MCB2313633.1 hypothetical protein [Clostridium tagluense]MCB2318465.1 hypothetical protein [Clostridium tagluense]MCB2323299.1 hypothetical protein [Clostridium tagluense]MCB2328242.1 hypothetical protein [Clostridium tagluense]MCB2333001.1 hypothetical protein [Clostridium tagluense]